MYISTWVYYYNMDFHIKDKFHFTLILITFCNNWIIQAAVSRRVASNAFLWVFSASWTRMHRTVAYYRQFIHRSKPRAAVTMNESDCTRESSPKNNNRAYDWSLIRISNKRREWAMSMVSKWTEIVEAGVAGWEAGLVNLMMPATSTSSVLCGVQSSLAFWQNRLFGWSGSKWFGTFYILSLLMWSWRSGEADLNCHLVSIYECFEQYWR